MAGYGKFRAAIISKAEYDSEGVGYSTVQEDFPVILGPLAAYDQIDILMKPWGRDPATGLPLFVNESGVDRWTGTITQDGINSSSAYATPTKDTIPAACITIVQVTAASVLLAIDNAAKHFVLGIEDPDIAGDPLSPGLAAYGIDEPFPSARWTDLRAGLIALGLNGVDIDNWYSNHPDATPRDFGKVFKEFIT